MNDQRLEELLRSADADLPAAVPAALADTVRRRARRRRAVARLAGPAAVAVAMTLTFAVGHFGHPDRRIPQELPGRSTARRTVPPSLPGATVDVEEMRTECARLAREADLHAKRAASLLRAEDLVARRTRAANVLAEPDAGHLVAEQLDRAAKALVDFGDDVLRRQPGSDASARTMAVGAYRDAAALSPGSPAAAVARQRLQRMNI